MPHIEPRSPQPTSSPSGERERLSAGPEALFVYGSLRFPEVLFALIDRVPDREPAAAEGWRVATLPERVYPGLVPGSTTARGFLLTGLTLQEWRVLDAFEDSEYQLLPIDLADGRHGWTYVCDQGVEVGPDDWSAEDFEAHHLPAFVVRCEAWRRRYETSEQVG
ncbi:gamma-glutamylcyclotransferase family protein [Spirillospora sp. CA-142024]|uniref:gamma-glutamylcyclotransferase family protein n=1 Tax=Spirillospora sp. CA-142024 TaxID=3240036 RepID=UPI003D900050